MEKKSKNMSPAGSYIGKTPENELIKKEEFENSSEKNVFDSDSFWDGETIHDDNY